METIVKGAKKSVYIMTSSKGLVRKVESMKGVLQSLSKKGVDIKIAAPMDKDCSEVAKDLMGFSKVRHVDKINARFCVVDGKEIMFMVTDDKEVHPSYDIGIWVNTPFFANALGNMFEISWKSMKDANTKLKNL